MKILLYSLLSFLFILPLTISAQSGGAGPFPVITKAIVSDTCDKAFINLEVSADNLPLSYMWSNGSTKGNLTTYKVGSYTVTITDNVGNTIIGGPYEVNKIIRTPSITSPDILGDCKNKSTGYIHFNALYPNDKFYWSHDPNLHSKFADNLAAGNYSVYISDETGACKTQQFDFGIFDATPYIYNLEIGGISDCINNPWTSGYVSFDLGTNYPPCWGCLDPHDFHASLIEQNGILFTWTSSIWNMQKEKFKGLASPGSKKIYITGDGCTIDTTVIIPVLDPLSYNLFTTIPNETQNYSAFSSPKGGQAPFTYLWSDGSTDANRTDLLAGKTYYVTVTDVYGCTSTTKTLIKKKKGAYKLQVIPSKNILDVRSAEQDPIQYTCMLFDAFGKVYSLKENILTDSERQFDISNLATGVYYLSVQSADNMESYPFVVLK